MKYMEPMCECCLDAYSLRLRAEAAEAEVERLTATVQRAWEVEYLERVEPDPELVYSFALTRGWNEAIGAVRRALDGGESDE